MAVRRPCIDRIGPFLRDACMHQLQNQHTNTSKKRRDETNKMQHPNKAALLPHVNANIGTVAMTMMTDLDVEVAVGCSTEYKFSKGRRRKSGLLVRLQN